jgi:hypothetical protein
VKLRREPGAGRETPAARRPRFGTAVDNPPHASNRRLTPGGGRTNALPVFGLALVEIWAAIPAGVILGVPAPAIWLLTVAGSLVGIATVAFVGDAVRERLVRRFAHGRSPTGGRIGRVWERYGVPGWGLVSPLFFAPAMGTAIALLFGASRRRLLVWMSAGVLVWTTLLVAAAELGLDLVHPGR